MNVISQIAPDFTLLDVWELPVEGRREDFDAALELLSSLNPESIDSRPARALFALRDRLGRWLHWDDAKSRTIPGTRETTLSIRLPEGLRGSAARPVMSDALRQPGAHFVPLYRTHDEWAAEVSNETVHGVIHLGWIPQGDGRYRGRMTIYVLPRGWLGRLYMLLIQPFRHLVVYPALMRHMGRAWAERGGSSALLLAP